MSDSLQPARLLCPWGFPGKSPGVGCHFLLQEIFLNQGLNPHVLHWQADSLPLSSTSVLKMVETKHKMALHATWLYMGNT